MRLGEEALILGHDGRRPTATDAGKDAWRTQPVSDRTLRSRASRYRIAALGRLR